MPPKFEKLPLPLGGEVRRGAFGDQPPGTSPTCLNVRPQDWNLQRDRIGSRPGLLALASGTSGVVRWMGDVEYIVSETYTVAGLAIGGGTLFKSTDFSAGASWSSPGGSLVSTAASAAVFLQKVYLAYNASDGKIVVYSPVAGTYASLVESAGAQPTFCSILCDWRGRIVASGDKNNITEIYFSKQNDPTDWNYTASGPGAAVKLSASMAGLLSLPVKCLAVHSDNRLIIGLSAQIWALNGDPLAGGHMVRLSDKIGIISQNAYCFLPDQSMMFVGWDGLYILPSGGGMPIPVSREYLPQELTSIETASLSVSLSYDPWHHGVHVFVGKTGMTGTSSHFWVTHNGKDWGFWPCSFADPITSCWAFRPLTASSATDSLVGLGTAGGKINVFDRAVACEAASNFDLGPIDLAGPGRFGKLLQVQPAFAASGGSVTVKTRFGLSGEEAYNASAFTTRTYSGSGLQSPVRPRGRGRYAYINFSAVGGVKWALEQVGASVGVAGKSRVG